jgi:hypothetical protein
MSLAAEPLELELVTDGAEPDRTTLDSLDLDVQLRIVAHLDGRSLANYAESTNNAIARLLCPYLGPMWASLHSAQLDEAPAAPSPPKHEEPLAFQSPPRQESPTTSDVLACKSQFVRTMAALERRCPRCGRQSSMHAGGPLDDHGRRQRHMCDWLTTPGR